MHGECLRMFSVLFLHVMFITIPPPFFCSFLSVVFVVVVVFVCVCVCVVVCVCAY